MKHSLLRLSLKGSSVIKNPSSTARSMLWVSNLFAAWTLCNLQTHQLQTGKGKPFANYKTIESFRWS